MFFNAKDTISGQEGRATANIDGNIQDMFFLKSLEATFDKNKIEVRTLGRRGAQHKGVGWGGSGSLEMFYATTMFRKLALKYAKQGKDTFFDITVVNEDPTSTIGRQTVVLYNCNFDSVVLAKLATEDEVLDESMDFTFDDFDILDAFGVPIM